jgi:hypothetical protein
MLTPTKGFVVYEGRHRFSVAHLLVAIVAMFIVLPIADRIEYGRLVESVIFTILMLAAVSAVGGRRGALIIAALLAAPAILMRWLSHIGLGLPTDVHLIAAVVFVAFVIWQLLRFVIAAPQVNAEVLCAAISVYLLFALAWSFIYTILWRGDPSALVFTNPVDSKAELRGFNALYYSVQVLTTITFGDILPVSNLARMLTLVEAVFGVFYLAILVARLVGLYSSAGTSNGEPDSSGH